ncbi:tRNA preQ1(34) S-adenosylmethionine ribosyltransferase-isomerase QueA [Candidatus Saccharibacteria bacterium]|nr:tRNA preQ1(34) S-adenosylmethionine ribosyltransferase-isomerase QueA [Candidatus Saccharibacteria bacterium]
MNTSDFDYNLPEELIAQTPLKDRSSSKLLVVDKEANNYEDRHFTDIVDYLHSGDALVLNETKVLPARFFGYRADTGGKIEVLLLKDLGNNTWECLTRPQKRLKADSNRSLYFFKDENDNTPLFGAHVKKILDDGITHLTFTCDNRELLKNLDIIGTMPLPPYIHEKLKEQSRYQTVYAKNLGSAAAPTAGLHFTPELLEKAAQKGVKIVKITLHVGLGTFRPVQVENIKDHKMHTESYAISKDAADTLNEIKASGGKIVAVGTTSVRTLETVMKKHGKFVAEKGETDIFIYPGYQFKAIDALITNFHLPKSTLLMLVSAFANQDLIKSAYEHAVKEKYRFFSFGDAMLII